ncbi:MAG TPA: hypothetical protein VGU01_13405 [Sphingomicrobium sp.]|nr:hypothetical protein [Sphingomicrobium sp.]
MFRLPFISCFVLLTIAACSSRSPVDAQAKANSPVPDLNPTAPTAIGEPHGKTMPAEAIPTPSAKIPLALQGRWALAPSDCSSAESPARGLMTVTADGLHFFESRAVPASEVGVDDTSIGGNFAFTGDGRSWTKYEALKFANHRLTRTEINPTASFSYAKCS